MQFTVCPDRLVAAAAWPRNCNDFVLMHLASAKLTGLGRPLGPSEESWRESCQEIELLWAPGGQYLVMHGKADHDGGMHEWAIFMTSTGEWCGPR